MKELERILECFLGIYLADRVFGMFSVYLIVHTVAATDSIRICSRCCFAALGFISFKNNSYPENDARREVDTKYGFLATFLSILYGDVPFCF